VPEVVEEGVTGFMVGNLEEAVRAAEHLPRLSRWRCRQRFEERFSAARMARDYLAMYRRLVERHPTDALCRKVGLGGWK
jgi:glycosyltransferase involved in cell wall biosynthesis